MRVRIHSQHRVLPFSCWPWEGFRKESRILTIQRGFHSDSMEEIREPCVLRVVPNEKFLHTNTNNKDVHVDNGATEHIPEDACSLRQYG